MNQAISEVEGISDRAGAIVASALVEDHLTTVVKKSLHQDDQTIREMFDGTGPLAAFSTKIKMAFLIGILSKRACGNLRYIRRIRNEFAHRPSGMTYDTQPICDLALNLDLHTFFQMDIKLKHPITDALHELRLLDDIREKIDTPKYRFIGTCRLFLAHFTVIHPYEPPEPLI